MRISFDLDDTLFVSPQNHKIEKPPIFPLNVIFKERLRKGTVNLMNVLHEMGIEIWIYTTSFRSQRYIKALFKCYKIKIDEAVNGFRHAKEVQEERKEAMPSKYPSKYRINLHVDDDLSVAQNGKIYGFKVVIISENDENWTKEILNQIDKIRM